MKLQDLKPGVRYSHDEVKHLLKQKKVGNQISIHEISEYNRMVFDEISTQIRKLFPEAVIFATGSRTTDLHREDSDFDVYVIIEPEKWPAIRQIQFNYKVDFLFNYIPGFLI